MGYLKPEVVFIYFNKCIFDLIPKFSVQTSYFRIKFKFKVYIRPENIN